jgi:parvulin-like peptidyl-prolyl isomerase
LTIRYQETQSVRHWIIGCVSLWVAFGSGCWKTPPPGPIDDLPLAAALLIDPARVPEPQNDASSDDSLRELDLSHILISYQGSDNPHKRPWTRAQARVRAEALTKIARAKGMDFALLATMYSDDAQSREQGGELAVFIPGQLHPDVERAGFALKNGQISDPVETNRGFHILQRHEPTEAQAFDLLISYDGAQYSSPRQSRTREAAKKLAQEILGRFEAGANFAKECLRYSDHSAGGRAGFKPIFRKGTQNPEFERHLWALPLYGLSPIIETPTGFHIIKRFPVERIQVRQIVIHYQNSTSDRLPTAHSREQALDLIRELYQKATAPNADFAALASEHSEGGEKSRGGLLETAGRGQRDSEFDDVAFNLAVLEVSRPVEIGSAFALIKRTR